MPKAFIPQIVTANDLMQGDVVYFTDDNGWSREHGDAAVAETAEAAALLLKSAEQHHLVVVGPYLAPTQIGDDGRPAPTHFREIFRTTGPTFREDLRRRPSTRADAQESA